MGGPTVWHDMNSCRSMTTWLLDHSIHSKQPNKEMKNPEVSFHIPVSTKLQKYRHDTQVGSNQGNRGQVSLSYY